MARGDSWRRRVAARRELGDAHVQAITQSSCGHPASAFECSLALNVTVIRCVHTPADVWPAEAGLYPLSGHWLREPIPVVTRQKNRPNGGWRCGMWCSFAFLPLEQAGLNLDDAPPVLPDGASEPTPAARLDPGWS